MAHLNAEKSWIEIESSDDDEIRFNDPRDRLSGMELDVVRGAVIRGFGSMPTAATTTETSGGQIPANGVGPGKVITNQQQKQPYIELMVRYPRLNRRPDYNELVYGQGRARGNLIKRLARAHEKAAGERSAEEEQLLVEQAHLLPDAKLYLKRKQDSQLFKQRLQETEEASESVAKKACELAALISCSNRVLIYTGAGISTSASIPDYRGPNGLYTQGRYGMFARSRVYKLIGESEPTYTHMAISELCRRKLVKHVVSQNFDGLHLRSGLSPSRMSEIHGNMFIETCQTCERQYFRQADVTQRTARFRHKTGRKCHDCPEPDNNLLDTIVVCGERSRSKMPMNWDRAKRLAKQADLIICLGTSCQTLRRYRCLWPRSITNAPKGEGHETQLVVVNLQHTPKDKQAVMKISAKCDQVMRLVMEELDIEVPSYSSDTDPLLGLATPFTELEKLKIEQDSIFDPPKTPKVKRQARQASSAKRKSAPESCHAHSCQAEAAETAPDDRDSPSLFVSELTDDPDKRSLRMRIRALTPSQV